LEKDRIIIKQQLEQLASDSHSKKLKLEKIENEEAKCDLVSIQNSPIKTTWIRLEQKCSKCGQKVSSNRRKSV